MKVTIRRKLALLASGLSLIVLGGGSVFAATAVTKSSQDAANAKLDVNATAAADPDCNFYSATNSALQRRVYTNNTPTVYTTTNWVNMQCGSFSVSVPRGKAALVVVKTDAEISCTVASSTDSQWCQGRVLIDGAEGQPSAPEPDSFAWANSSADPNAWESNAFTRTATVRCPANHEAALCTYMVRAQIKNHAANMSFRIDDSTVDADVTYY